MAPVSFNSENAVPSPVHGQFAGSKAVGQIGVLPLGVQRQQHGQTRRNDNVSHIFVL
jgi:hypothetical protein